MSEATLQLGNGKWAVKSGNILGYHTYQADKLKYFPNELTFTRASTATRVAESGLIESVASGVPRIDFTGGGEGKLLLEPQRTNLLLRSQEIDNVWNYGLVTISANVTTSPDGTTNADKVIASAATGDHFIRQIPGLSSNTYTFTCYAKKAEYKYLVLYRIGSVISTYFNLDTGVVDSAAIGVTASMEDVGNGWFRCIATYTYVSGAVLDIAISNTLGVTNFLGDGTSGIYIWGVDLQVGTYPTSYIPTAGSTVTRVADNSNTSGLSSVIGQTEGTIWLDIYAENPYINDDIFHIQADTSNWIRFRCAGAGSMLLRINNSGVVSSATIVNYTNWDRLNIIVTYSNGSVKAFLNGTKVIDLAWSFNTGVTYSILNFDAKTKYTVNKFLLEKAIMSEAEAIELTTI